MIRLICLLVFVAYSCSPATVVGEKPSVTSPDSYSPDSLYIYLTGGFKNDSLMLEYADIQLFESDISTTKHGYAKEIVLPKKGTERIHVSLFRPANTYSTQIISTGGNFIEVWYCKDDILKHYIRNKPFIFE